MVILDIKHISEAGYKKITGININKSLEFIEILKKTNKKIWIRQVIVPGIIDSEDYLISLDKFIKTYFDTNNIEKIEFLPYHKLGREKYIKMNIPYPCENIEEMDKEKCNELYNKFINIYKNK